jgi:hypothetical protein
MRTNPFIQEPPPKVLPSGQIFLQRGHGHRLATKAQRHEEEILVLERVFKLQKTRI